MNKPTIITTKDGSHSLHVAQLNENYHSVHGAVQEGQHVFIDMGLQYVAANNKNIKLLEVGWGTGLNCLLTYLAMQQLSGISIHYTGIEGYPIPLELATQLNYAKQIGDENTQSIFKKMHIANWNRIFTIGNNFTLMKLQTLLENWQPTPEFHLIYFDAFAPNAQSEMWELPMLEKMYHALVGGGVLTTYCAKGSVKRAFKQLGFTLESLPGPPGKREMIRCIK